MRILVVGAGAVGGYFGGRLLEKGEDVTFLVRENRKKQIEKNGLVIKSVHGDVTLQPNLIQAGDDAGLFDVILFSTKAYHINGAIDHISPYVGAQTMILPLLNGILHIEKLIEVFGSDKVIGGLCFIESTLNADGEVLQTSPGHMLMFGERDGEKSERMSKLQNMFSGTKADFRYRQNIMQEIWHKYMFITAMSGVTTLFRAPVGPIRDEQSGAETLRDLFKEIGAVMRKIEAPIAEDAVEVQLGKFNAIAYGMKSSMQRDMEKGLPIEADHLQGYLLNIAKEKGIPVPVLQAVYTNLKLYEKQLNA